MNAHTCIQLAEAHDEFSTGCCRPHTPENIAKALANLKYEENGERLMKELARLAVEGDVETFGCRVLASIDDYWQAEARRVVERRAV